MRTVRVKRLESTNDGSIVTIDCPFCGEEHTHGNVKDGECRIAHCAVSDVPDHDGYVIKRFV